MACFVVGAAPHRLIRGASAVPGQTTTPIPAPPAARRASTMACFVVGAAPHRMFRGTSAAPAEMTTARRPQVEASDFDWMGHLGSGGFASVSKVRHRRTAEVFALKEAFKPSNDGDADEEEEAEVLRRANRCPSPYVVRCHAVFLEPLYDTTYGTVRLTSVLELMDAGSLRAVLRRRRGRGFPEPVLAEVAYRCLMGLARLHSRGVAHLDVKPDNFLCNAAGDIKIADFNASRVVYGPAGESLVVPTSKGTSKYFSPERFEPDPHADARGAMAADVWGLGITILELFLGRPPVRPDVEKPKASDWKEVICGQDPPSVPEYMEGSAELRYFVFVCLQKDPAWRARVSRLLMHPFVTGRDVASCSRALRDLIVQTL